MFAGKATHVKHSLLFRVPGVHMGSSNTCHADWRGCVGVCDWVLVLRTSLLYYAHTARDQTYTSICVPISSLAKSNTNSFIFLNHCWKKIFILKTLFLSTVLHEYTHTNSGAFLSTCRNILTSLKNLIILYNQATWHRPVVPTVQKAKAGESFEPRSSIPLWVT